ncbi:hypothetical protein GCM10011502_25790 [Oceanisphaera marina]|uniref:Gp5/Type VI secretion system Vgr protein OB-fold domain-containing protein n=1 Tax=Oceanisphaera marina TaxID=2017550 RepID=A0ABQ1ISM8_9GAMM|nr:hypothetical protein GCM10011502_25790 [Oceanisphaera marina]
MQGVAELALGQAKPGANQHQAWLHLGELGEQSVYDYQGEERISGCYQVQVTLVCSTPLPALSSLLQQPATLVLQSPHGTQRYVHGLVFAMAELDRSDRHLRYQLTLVPPLALLALRRGVRIFQNVSVPDIVEQLLTEAGLSADTRSWRLSGNYPLRDYCVQYNETELAFIERILAEEGIHYHFAHGPDGTLLILADGPEGLDTLAELPFKAEAGLATEQHAIHRFRVGPEVRSGSVSLRDTDFTRPSLQLHPNSLVQQAQDDAQDSPDEHGLEDYSWPGPFTSQARGSQLTDLSLARHRHDREQVDGASDSPQLMAGHYQPLGEHPESQFNQAWLITQLSYQGKQPQVLGELADGQSTYSNTFTAQPWTSPYKPPCPAKPQVPGQQSAIVTGPAGEEIYCDEYGRVKVQFYWDREGQGDEKTSTWLRVSQGWAGNGYGQLILPRVGMEVLVSFINGDPDRPIITGCLFNGNNQLPYALPEHKTRSTFKTASSPGGEGSNELRFEDKAGSEEIYLHAARDYQERIENNSHSHIVNDRQQLIEGQHIFEVRGEHHHTVHGTHHYQSQADEHHVVDGSRHTLIANKELVSAGQEIHLSTGQKVVLEAGAELTFKAGGSFLKLDPSGVTLVGPTIDLNNGGQPSAGSRSKILLPLLGSLGSIGNVFGNKVTFSKASSSLLTTHFASNASTHNEMVKLNEVDYSDVFNPPEVSKTSKTSKTSNKNKEYRVTDIPSTMRKKLNWEKSADVMDLWFSLPAREMTREEKLGKTLKFPKEYINTTLFPWSWLSGFSQVQEGLAQLNNNIFSPDAQKTLKRKCQEMFASRRVGDNYLWDGDIWSLHNNWQFQLQVISYQLFNVDDLYGSLGNFAIYAAITSARIKRKAGTNIASVHISEIGVYMRDTFEFIGDQYLGHWDFDGAGINILAGVANSSPERISFEWQLKSWTPFVGVTQPFGNKDFRKYREQNNKGGDLLLFSDVKKLPFDFSVNIVLEDRDVPSN